jgi:MSHA biogenesis protein MshP
MTPRAKKGWTPVQSVCGGFTMISAIFLLVIMAGLGAAMLKFSAMQQASSGLDLQGTRAYQAAHAGMEWSLWQVLQNVPPCSSVGTTTTFALPATTTLSEFSVTVVCTFTAVNAVITPFTMYQIKVTSCNQPTGAGATCPGVAPLGRNYIERQIMATVSR